MLYLTLVLDWTAILYASNFLREIPWYDIIPLVFLMALLASMSFLIAHELFHKENIVDKVMGNLFGN